MNIKPDSMKRIIPILGLVCTVFFSCTMNEMVFDDLNDSGQEKLITRTSVTNDDEDFAPVEHNPYSLSVMQSVYDNYSLEQVELEPTDLYVRFMPQDSTQFHFLLYESGLELFDYPLDVDLTDAEIDSLETAETEYSFNWLYTTVKPDYDFPAEMTYEILDECYIPEENESIVQTRGGLSVDVEAAAYQSLGYDDFEDVDGDVLTRAGRVTPEGTIKVYVSQNNYAPLKGVKIRGHRFVKYSTTYTDANGHYALESKFRHRLHYAIVYDNIKDFDIWGNYGPLARANCNLGWHDKDGYSKNIENSERAWRWSVINNAGYDYYSMCERTGITKPPRTMKIWCWRTASSSSTPMLRRLEHGIGLNVHSGWANFFANLGYGLTTTTLQGILRVLLPDITIGTSGKDYESIYEHVNHELAHASHYSQVGSAFWAKYVSYIMSYGAYGNGTGNNAELCGIGEMWGDYMGNLRKYESLKPSIPKKYPETNNEWFKPEVFWDLDRNGSLSRKNIFDCLTSDVKTYDALYSKMREKFPEKVDSIKACFSRYGIIEDVEEPVTEDVTFSGRTVSESTTVTGTNISVHDVSVINGAKLTLVGNVSIGSTFFVESGSSLEIRQR